MIVSIRLLAAFLLAVLITMPSPSQEVRYYGPYPEDSFFPIGWSNDGTVFAYGWFETTQMISAGSQLVISIQDS